VKQAGGRFTRAATGYGWLNRHERDADMARLDPGPSIKTGDRYEVLRRPAVSQEKRALISTQKKGGRRATAEGSKTSWSTRQPR
jgi:hypothetical protein